MLSSGISRSSQDVCGRPLCADDPRLVEQETMRASMGIPAKVVQEILGHSSVTITQNLYGHVIEGMQEEAMQRMDDLFKKDGTN